MQPAQNSKKILGKVTAPSGIVLLIDFGLMDFWTHDRPPLVPSGVLSAEALKSANDGADFSIEGPDALVAGIKFDRQPHPLFLYDIPRHSVPEIKEHFEALVLRDGYKASLLELQSRVSPRKRADQALAQGLGAGEVFLHGMHAIAISGVAPEQELVVEGRPMEEGAFTKHWRDISLVVLPDGIVTESRKIGHVAVDMARLMFCDLEAAGQWQHQDTIDGLADLVFWGRDALRLAKKFGAAHLEGSIYGFVDKPINEMAGMAVKLQKHLEQHRLVAATDFRPHSDHWRMLKSISQHDTESAQIDLGSSSCCGFMTSWGDGFFPVYLDFDSSASLVRVRIDLGTEETIKGMHMVNRFS